MNIWQRVAALPPIVVTAAYLTAIAGLLTVNGLAVHLIVLGWPLCLYITARQRTEPPPQKRYPLVAKIAFATAITGSVIGTIFQPPKYSPPAHDFQTYIFAFAAGAFAIGAIGSFWVAADALLKAETGKPWIANPTTTHYTMQLIFFLPIGIWFLNPRIKRLLDQA